MLNLFICEDNKEQRMLVEECVRNYAMIHNLGLEIVCSTDNPHAIIEYMDTHDKSNNLYFLDVDLGADMTGLELGMMIRNKDTHGSIVFITTHPEYMALTFEYGVEALGYITKGNAQIMKEKIRKYINMTLDRLATSETLSEEMFRFKEGKRVLTERCENILFFESSTDKQKKSHYAREKQTSDFFGEIKRG